MNKRAARAHLQTWYQAMNQRHIPRRVSRCLAWGFLAFLTLMPALEAGEQQREETSPSPTRGLPDRLTLAQARELALGNNPDLRDAKARIEAALATLQQARSARVPSVDLSASARRQQRIGDPVSGGILDAPYEQHTLAAQLTWLLHTGGRIDSEITAATAGLRADKARLTDARRLLDRSVSETFRSVLLAKERIEVARRDAAFNAELEEEAKRRRAAGAAGREHVLNFQLRTTQARTQVVQAEERRAAARIALAQLLGRIPAELPERVELVFADSAFYADGVPEVEEEIRHALAERPDLQALRETRNAARQGVRQAKSGRKPTVSLTAGADWTATENSGLSDGSDDNAYVSLQATWQAVDGGETAATIEAALAQVERTRQQLTSARLAIDAEVRQRHRRLVTAKAEFELARETLDLTKAIRKIVLDRYRAGKSTITRVNEVQTDLTRAESELAAARIRLYLARRDLATAAARTAP